MKGRWLWWAYGSSRVVRNHAKYHHADYDTTVQLFTCTFMLSRAPFRFHALRDLFLSFVLSSLNPCKSRLRQNSRENRGEEFGREGKRKKKKVGASLLMCVG